MEVITMFVCLISATMSHLQEFCATQDILVSSEMQKEQDYCALKQFLLDKENEAGNPYEPVMTECRVYVPDKDADRVNAVGTKLYSKGSSNE